MKYSKSFPIILSLIIANFSLLYAQNAVSVAGGEANGVGGNASYTIGLTTYTTFEENSGSIAQGIQQGYIISDKTNTSLGKYISLTCKAFPNPTSDNLILTLGKKENIGIVASLLDINGRLIMTKNIDEQVSSISMKSYACGIYLLKISKIEIGAEIGIKTFKIIKN